MVATFPTGNPHTDIDFFTKGGETYMSAGTLGTGPNGGGQTILQADQRRCRGAELRRRPPLRRVPEQPGRARSASSTTSRRRRRAARSSTSSNTGAVNKEAQLLIDASDANGRCHDGGTFGLVDTAQGGLEIIDISNPAAPKEIGLTSHIGEAHTVNIDPKRPHIAYAVTSDSVSVDENGVRANEIAGQRRGAEPRRLRGRRPVLVHELPAPARRSRPSAPQCRPEVYRYRYPSANIALGHTLRDHIYACHESRDLPRPTCSPARAATRRSCST